jgi:hypothetical protein
MTVNRQRSEWDMTVSQSGSEWGMTVSQSAVRVGHDSQSSAVRVGHDSSQSGSEHQPVWDMTVSQTGLGYRSQSELDRLETVNQIGQDDSQSWMGQLVRLWLSARLVEMFIWLGGM